MADSKIKTFDVKDSSIMESFLSNYAKLEKTESLVKTEPSALQKTEAKTRIAVLNDTNEDPPDANNLLKSVLDYVQRNENERVHRLAFEVDPTIQNAYQSVYRQKKRLIPDTILKRVAINDELVAAIVQTRCNQMAPFGRPRPDRFSIGYLIEPEPGILAQLTIEEKETLHKRIKVAIDRLYTCGSTKGWSDKDSLTLPQCLIKWTRNVCTVGRIATEIIKVYNHSGQKVFHSFRPIDAGTIYYATPQKSAAENVRMQAKKLLETLNNEKLDPRRFEADEYAYIQVIDGQPRQAFTEDECVVYNFYPIIDIELDDYPVTPIDTAITAITTHINISTHSKMYFQSGRATKGMIVIKSDDVDEKVVANWKQQFNAQINNVNNSHRLPLLSVGQKDDIIWQPIDAARDMEFQYLSDMNARVIMSAFQISPEELTGFSYLSRGTNSQALSECFSPNTKIITTDGHKAACEILGNLKEKNIIVWTGKKWNEAKIFWTGKKNLSITKLECGLELSTSPDHRFKVIDENGEPIWKNQSDLKIGDCVLVNKNIIDGNIKHVPIYDGKQLTLEIMEVLGWMIGDGCHVQARQRSGASIHLFFHHEKERDIWEKYEKILKDFGVQARNQEFNISQEEIDEIKIRHGFKNVSNNRIKTIIYDTKFINWLESIGFKSSSQGKEIPDFLFSVPLQYRAAFLRGFFSADGGKLNNTGSVCLTVQNEKLRNQTRELLISMGIRTLPCKGILRRSGFNGIQQKTFSHKLFIKDRGIFWDLIGFIQPHKQLCVNKREKWKINEWPDAVLSNLAKKCLNEVPRNLINKSAHDTLVCVAKGTKKCTLSFIKNILEKSALELPNWLKDFNCEKIESIESTNQIIEMVDITVFDDEHSFILNGFQVHNSNNEYKLLAHRDLGIKPLLLNFEDFVNAKIFPLIDPDLAKICRVKFVGLDAETREKEGILIQQNQQLHYTYNQILEEVEKPLISKEMAGDFPLNPLFQAVLKDYLTFGEILEYFFNKKGASKDPQFSFYQNQSWIAWQQIQQTNVQQQQALQAQTSQLSDQEREQHYNQGAQDESHNKDLVSTLDSVVSALKPEEK